ncbi:MAG TPA: hypothetical protein VGP62_26055 [Bryobacteraceae bacterium]|jgi:hypothetical protein|nr:hypothetical protein [Bryobacteraceae bacterium]
MMRKLLLLASLMLALGTIVSADMPAPPCDPNCGNKEAARLAG